MTNGIENKRWWDNLVDQLNMEELFHMHVFLDEFEQSLLNKIFFRTNGDPVAFPSLRAPPSNPEQATNHFLTKIQRKTSPSCNSFPQSYDGFIPDQF